MSSFFGLNIAVSALRAQQYGMSVTAHNIANANTEGYRRQEPVFVPGNPLMGTFATTGIGIPQLGTGVLVRTIRRMQAEFIDGQVRMANQYLGSWSARNEALQQVESVLGEPSDNGLSHIMDQFWNSWEELAVTPESLASRIAVVEKGAALADRIRNLYRDLRVLQTETDDTIAAKASEINRLAHEIASLNEQITRSAAGGYQPNDLMDRRDLIVEQLSHIVRAEVHGAAGSEMIVSIGGKALVQGNLVCEINVSEGPTGWSELMWSDDNSPVLIPGGQLKGLTDIRDVLIEDYIGSLNTITQAIVARVNALHSTGTGMDGTPAGDFFTAGSDASNITVDAALLAAPSGVAASGTGAPGDNSIANAIAAVRYEALVGGETVATAYTSLVGRIGSQASEADTRTNVHQLSIGQLRTQRESISGVSLDEETVNMVRFQQAYNAAARIATVLDEMIDTVVNRMGIVGR